MDIFDDNALVLCDALVDYLPYHSVEGEITWKDCSLRRWLNDDFIKAAFNVDEMFMLQKSPLFDDPSIADRLFILSKEEIEKYLSGETDKKSDCKLIPARTAAILGGPRGFRGSLAEAPYWWVRNPDYTDPRFGSMIGHIDSNGLYGSTPSYCERWVRPACWIKMSDLISR